MKPLEERTMELRMWTTRWYGQLQQKWKIWDTDGNLAKEEWRPVPVENEDAY